MDLKTYIREIPDFPVPGILFRDITTILGDPAAFKYVIDRFAEQYNDNRVDAVVAIEARGFLFGAPLAYRLGIPVIPVRKEGKLPNQSFRAEYALEYGTNVVEMHTDAIRPGQNALIIDDLLATGGTLEAAIKLVELTGGRVAGVAVVIELLGLDGRARLRGYDIFPLVQYEGV